MKYLKNIVRHKLRNNEPTLGSWLNIPSLEVTEIMARSGFEFLVIDAEHGSMNLEAAQKMTMVIEGHNCIPFVRVEKNDASLIKRTLEIGCYGVIIPMVNTKAEAKRAVESVYYPPLGLRGTGLSRAQGYGLEFNRYKDWYKDNLSLIVQIEHIEAINNLEEILSVDEIDATIVGPYDLSASLGYPGIFDKKEVLGAIDKYKKICRKYKKPTGIHVIYPDAQEANKRIEEGFNFIVFSLDMLFLGKKIEQEFSGIAKGKIKK
jgi:2-dehydro-3-deoxyglucarate aldolase